ncbi:MAG: DNA translocase FtsK 4TM domain-containing protein, partial [Pseudomonadota bacterium]|nr:DNA translocase FtsK 4TM domain-containing protein [Pseudomonadota bacterium]
VGKVGSVIGFYGFHFFGVSVFLTPIFLFWFGIRLLIQQERGKRVLAAIASESSSQMCSSSSTAKIFIVPALSGAVSVLKTRLTL